MTEAQTLEHQGGQGLSITSLVFGILAIVTCMVWYIGILFGISAIVCGVISIKKRGRKKAIAGIITGSVGIVLSLAILLLIQAAVPSLQKNNRNTLRKNDVSILASNVLQFQTENQGQLPGVDSLETSSLGKVTSVTSSGQPTTEIAFFQAGTDCSGTSSARAFSITILLEDGSPYCQGS